MTPHETPAHAADRPPYSLPDEYESERFAFGKNWASFLRVLNDARIRAAEQSLRDMLGDERLAGASFLDIGCGSGLFSLAALRLGAGRVHSFDFDPESVACARELRRRYLPDASNWTIEQADVLDEAYVRSLGRWTIVYSWGVLHHTGNMWEAVGRAAGLVDRSGVLFIAIYNDEGLTSRMWTAVKRLYNRHRVARALVLSVFVPYFAARGLAADLLRGTDPFRRYREYQAHRGMSMLHDWIDWLGGYPFEVASPQQIIDCCTSRGFTLERLVRRRGKGCNEYVFGAPPA